MDHWLLASLEDGGACRDAERKEENRELPRSQVLMGPGEAPLDGLSLLRMLSLVWESDQGHLRLAGPTAANLLPVSPSTLLDQD